MQWLLVRFAAMVVAFIFLITALRVASGKTGQERTNGTHGPGTGQEQPNVEASSLRATFGKASHVVVGAIIDVAAYNRSGQKLDNLPEILGKRQYLELTLHVVRILASVQGELTEKIPVRLEAPGLQVPVFLFHLTTAKKVFFLKRDFQVQEAPHYYPADRTLFFTDISSIAELEEWAKQRGANTPEFPQGVKAYYRVPGRVPYVPQDGGYDCWAAAAAMMLSWRDQVEYTKEQAAKTAGDIFVQMLLKRSTDQALPATSKQVFLERIGLLAEGPQTFTPHGLRDLIEEHGPLWVTINIGGSDVPPDFLLPHARVIIAIEGDGSPDGTFLTYLDPDPFAARQRESIQEFTQTFEEVAEKDLKTATGKEKQPFRPQVLHF